MSEHDTPAVKIADDPAFKLPTSLSSLSMPLCIGGVAVLLIGWACGSSVSAKFGMSAYLTAFMFCLTIVLGSLFFVMIQHLVRAGWSVVVRRIAEHVSRYEFDRLYGNFGGSVLADASGAVRRSADRYAAWVSGVYDDLT